MPYQSVGDFLVDVMMNQFDLSNWNCNDDSDLYESIDLINLEEPIRLPSPHRIIFSVCLSIHLFHMKTCRIFMQELKSGCPHGVFYPSSIPSKYLFLCVRRKFGFNNKIRRNLPIVYSTCITNLPLAIHTQSVNGLKEPF